MNTVSLREVPSSLSAWYAVIILLLLLFTKVIFTFVNEKQQTSNLQW